MKQNAKSRNQAEKYHPTELEDPQWHINNYFSEKNIPVPTRSFQVGDKVKVGCLENSTVAWVSENKKFYVIESDNRPRYGQPVEGRYFVVVAWTDVLPYRERYPDRISSDVYLNPQSSNTSLSGVILRFYSFGVDESPKYQRDYVWTLEQKQKLIDTLLRRGSIGTFAFRKLKYKPDGYSFELIDGKQRLKAIRDYLEGRFQYNGLYFHELHPGDRYAITDCNVAVYELPESSTEVDALRFFLRVNVAGTPIDTESIDNAKKMLAELDANAPAV